MRRRRKCLRAGLFLLVGNVQWKVYMSTNQWPFFDSIRRETQWYNPTVLRSDFNGISASANHNLWSKWVGDRQTDYCDPRIKIIIDIKLNPSSRRSLRHFTSKQNILMNLKKSPDDNNNTAMKLIGTSVTPVSSAHRGAMITFNHAGNSLRKLLPMRKTKSTPP